VHGASMEMCGVPLLRHTRSKVIENLKAGEALSRDVLERHSPAFFYQK
jgi:hypothetical protein